MKRAKHYELLIIFVFIAMVLLCVYLNLFSAQTEGIANIAVNVGLFIIVGVIFVKCMVTSFMPMNAVINDLYSAVARIRQDAMNSKGLLLEDYRENSSDLFETKAVGEPYLDYLRELDRIQEVRSSGFRCNIEDYIGLDLVDSIMHRNQLNQVAGALTGLGILGTFIGLSLGLQSFSTGTTAEITNSIAPLMNGIKVAFHTSIYGMIFSLTFNYVYKKKLDEAESAVISFLNTFRKYVQPDPATEGINRLMELEEQQLSAMSSMGTIMAAQLSDDISNMLEPRFDRLDRIITDFANVAGRSQLEALSSVTSRFIDEMNRSLGNSFAKLANTIDDTYLTQKENSSQMKEILEKTGSSVVTLREVDRQASSVLNALSKCMEEVTRVQSAMGENLANLSSQNEANSNVANQGYKYLSDLIKSRKLLNESAEQMNRQLKEQEKLLGELSTGVNDMPERVAEMFRIINENLTRIETHFRDTILSIQDSTERVPDVISASYEDMERAYDKTALAVERLNDTAQRMLRNY